MTRFSFRKDKKSLTLICVSFIWLQCVLNLLKGRFMQMQKLVYKALSIRKRDFQNFEKKFLKLLKFRITSLSLLLIVTRNSFVYKPKDNGSWKWPSFYEYWKFHIWIFTKRKVFRFYKLSAHGLVTQATVYQWLFFCNTENV